MTGLIVIPFIISLIVLLVVALVVLTRLEKQRQRRRFRLEIVNTGNAHTRYDLNFEDLTGTLLGVFEVDGKALAGATNQSNLPALRSTAVMPSGGAMGNRGGGGGVGQTLDQVSGVASILTGILNTLGALLPGELGRSLMRMGSQANLAQTQAQRVQSLGSQAGALKQAVGPAQTSSTNAPINDSSQAPAATLAAGPVWVQTPTVKMGEALEIDLFITPLSRQAAVYGFSVMSRSSDQPSATPLTEQGTVAGGNLLTRILPGLTLLGLLSILGLLIWLVWTVVVLVR